MTLRYWLWWPVCKLLGHDARWVDAPELRGDFYVYPCKRCGIDLLPHPFAAVEKPEDDHVV